MGPSSPKDLGDDSRSINRLEVGLSRSSADLDLSKRRIALIGDAAHPFLPTSIQGASQVMEDRATLAVCLTRGGKAHVQEALAAFEALRYERVRAAQKIGEKTRDQWHKANWEEAKKNPESMKLKRGSWPLNFDAEEYAEENYPRTVALLNDPAAVRELHRPNEIE